LREGVKSHHEDPEDDKNDEPANVGAAANGQRSLSTLGARLKTSHCGLFLFILVPFSHFSVHCDFHLIQLDFHFSCVCDMCASRYKILKWQSAVVRSIFQNATQWRRIENNAENEMTES
jgi:hypothetical protein